MEPLDMSKPRAFVYHPTRAPKGKMVYLEEKETYLEKGWYDTPAKFPKEKEKNTIENVEPCEVLKDGGVDDGIGGETQEEATGTSWFDSEKEKFPKLDYNDVKDDASDLSDWLNGKYGLSTNYRQGLKKLQEIANDNRVKDNQPGSEQG